MIKNGKDLEDDSSRAEFPCTRWSVVIDAQDEDESALERLCLDYWFPIYSYARRQGATSADAEDLTQGFFGHFFKSDFIQNAHEARGRLRSFLLASFRNYCRQQWRKETAQKRGGGTVEGDEPRTFRIDGVSATARFELQLAEHITPEVEFERAWAREILIQSKLRLKQLYMRKGKLETYRILHPHMDGNSQPYREIALGLGCNESTARYKIFKMREAYRECVKQAVRDTVGSDEEAKAELDYLQSVFKTNEP